MVHHLEQRRANSYPNAPHVKGGVTWSPERRTNGALSGSARSSETRKKDKKQRVYSGILAIKRTMVQTTYKSKTLNRH